MTTRQQLRKKIRLQRSALSAQQQLVASQELLSQLAQNTLVKNAQHIGVYLANNGELDPMLFIEWCWQNNKNVYLPVLHPFSKGHLLFLAFTPKTILLPNRFGIPEPRLEKDAIKPLSQLDIIMTPLVAFDATGNRLGMGGGFYDRTLSQVHSSNKPYLLGLAHELQKVPALSTDSWDVPLSEIVTPVCSYLCI